MGKYKNFINDLAGKRKLSIIIVMLILGFALIIGGSAATKGPEKSSTSDSDEMYYSRMMEQRLEDFLKKVNGIKEVQVLVTVDGGNEYEYAEKGDSDGYPTDYLIIENSDGREAAVIRQIYPKIRGIGVSCTNGDKASVKNEVIKLLSAALGISANKIEVTAYNSLS